MINGFNKSMYWFASDDINIPSPDGFLMSGITTGIAANKVVATGLFPSTINFEPGDMIASDLDWLVAKVVRRISDDELLLDRDIFSAPGSAFRIYKQNNSTPGYVYNIAGGARDFAIVPLQGFVKYSEVTIFTVPANESLPVGAIQVHDTGTTLKKFMLLF